MNHHTTHSRTQNAKRPEPMKSSSVTKPPGGWTAWRDRFQSVWHAYQSRRIQTAIRTYSVEKHFQSRAFHPVVGESTMRMVAGQTERNKLPFHAEELQPWVHRLPQTSPVRLMEPRSTLEATEVETPSSPKKLPQSLRPLDAPPQAMTPDADEPPIILIPRSLYR